jgi:hypothetical protein
MMVLIASVAVLSTGTVILTTQAADQAPASRAAQPATGTAPPSTAGALAGATSPRSVTSGALVGATAPKPVNSGAPQVPEESATIGDDPTIAPDPKQSADNSVSFPNDI